MKIYSWNVNGIRAIYKKGLLQDFIAQHKPDILCMQETKAQREQIEVDFQDYEEHWSSAEKKGSSGTAIFTKESPEDVLLSLPEHISSHFPLKDQYGDTTTEGRITTVEYPDFYLSTVYTPNAKEDLSRVPMRQAWDPAYLSYLKELEAKKPVIFCGDLNVAHTEIDLARPKENEGKKGFTKEERSGFDAFLEAGFVDTFRHFNKEGGNYTWWSAWGGARERNVGWRIDYILVSRTLLPLVKSARIHPDVMGSDHCPVSIDITL